MLNPFPDLLMFSFFVPTLLRITVAVTLVYMALSMGGNKGALVSLRVPLIGTVPPWATWVSVCVTFLVALSLFVGFGTQISALLAIALILKHLWLGRYTNKLPLSKGVYILLCIICLSLLFSGAGALAFDLPL